MTTLHFLDPNPNGTPAVLLLHGLGATGASWTPNLPALTAAGFRPLAPDAPGFGDSPYDGRGWSIPRAAASLAALLDELQTGPAHVVGLSMGGVIAQQFAHDFPQLVKKLVLVSTFSALRPDDLGGWIYFLRRLVAVNLFGLRTQARVVAGRVFPGADQASLREMLIETISRADPRAYRGAMRALGLFDSRKWLAEIKIPALVVTGADDTTVSPARQRLLVDGIPGARQVVVPQAGHAVPVDRAETFNRLLLEFLGEP
ncbi:MAG: alpha/beta hydrolase fold protein [Anaerolineaceae bacterium]|nr:MAG: alpha/beta hydrolase fold protein [Anaerolineaceae bacterium]